MLARWFMTCLYDLTSNIKILLILSHISQASKCCDTCGDCELMLYILKLPSVVLQRLTYLEVISPSHDHYGIDGIHMFIHQVHLHVTLSHGSMSRRTNNEILYFCLFFFIPSQKSIGRLPARLLYLHTQPAAFHLSNI